MNTQNLQSVVIIASLIIGMLSAIYFYQSTDIFLNTLKKPLKYISSGMILISFGILLAVLISSFQAQGQQLLILNVPISFFFFLLYLIGSVLIFWGARQFAHRPA